MVAEDAGNAVADMWQTNSAAEMMMGGREERKREGGWQRCGIYAWRMHANRIATLKVERSAAACGSARHEIAARKVPSGKEIADAGRNAGDR